MRVKEKKVLLCVLFVYVFAGYAAATSTYFVDTDPANHLWQNSGNWTGGAIATDGTGDNAYVRSAALDLNTDTVGKFYNLFTGINGYGATVVNMTGGSLTSPATSTSGLSLGYTDDSTFNMIGGTFSLPNGMVRMGRAANKTATLNISGGTFTTYTLRLGYVTGAAAHVTVSGNGTLEINYSGSGISFLQPDTWLDIKGNGVLEWAGDQEYVINYAVTVDKKIFTTDPGKTIYAEYNETEGVTYAYAVAIPEPATVVLLGLASVAMFNRRRK